MRTAWALLVWSALTSTSALAADLDPSANLSEAWVRIQAQRDLARVEAVGLTLSEGRAWASDGTVEQRVIASPDALEKLRAQGFPVRITRADHRRGAPRGAYRDPVAGDAVLAGLAQATHRGGLVVLGTSVQGRPITGLWLGRPPAEGAPTWRVLGAHHGDEWSSFEVALDIAAALVDGDGADPAITALLDRATVLVVPYVNPDGTVAGSRYNARGVDLNRNYDYEWSPTAFRGGDHPFSEPETRAIRASAAFMPPLGSLSIHSGASNIGYVWNHSYEPTPEATLLEAIAQTYADACTATYFEATNGADWYVTHGDTNDWSYGRYGGMDYTLEVSFQKAPAAEHLPTVRGWHRDAILGFLDEPITLSGRVVDAETGEPVHAHLTLHRESLGAVPMTTHFGAGTFARVALPGAWSLQVEAAGYAPTGRALVVGDLDPFEIALEPAPVAEHDPVPRRVSGETAITLPGAPDGVATVSRPGHASIEVEVVEQVAVVDAARLAPGPWSIAHAGGTVWPSGLFVDDAGPTTLIDLSLDEDTWVVRGEGFAVGTRAWALVGPRRSAVPLPVLDESTNTLVLDASAVRQPGNADLLVLSNGIQVAALGLEVPAWAPEPSVSAEPGSCSCATPPSHPLRLLWIPLLILSWRRRP